MCGGKVNEPRRSHKNHDLHIEWQAARVESGFKEPTLGKGVPFTKLLAPKAKIPGMQ